MSSFLHVWFDVPADAAKLTSLLGGIYEPWLVLLSLLIAWGGGCAALYLVDIARQQSDEARYARVATLIAAFVLGVSIWSMHFIGMLAFEFCSRMAFEPWLSALSLLPGLCTSWVALQLLARGRLQRRAGIVGGALIGVGVGAMHFSGMAAMPVGSALHFSATYVGLALIAGMALAAMALELHGRLLRRHGLPKSACRLLSGALLGGATVAMHYIALGGTYLQGDVPLPGGNAERTPSLALSVALVTVFAGVLAAIALTLLRYRWMLQEIRQREARLRTIVDTAVDGIITIDGRGLIRSFNQAAERLFGWREAEVLGRNISMLMPEPHRSVHDSYLTNYLRSGEAKVIGIGREVEGLRRDGRRVPIRLAVGRAQTPHEPLFVGFVIDLSERRAMEQALRDSERQYRTLIANLPGVAFRCRGDADWSMLFISDAIEALCGWPASAFVRGDIHIAALIHPHDLMRIRAVVDEALMLNQPYDGLEYRILCRDGRERWVTATARGVRGEQGQLLWIDGVLIDVTENKRRSTELSGLVQAFDGILAVCETDMDGRIQRVNGRMLDMTGFSEVELLGRPHFTLCPPEYVRSGAYAELWAALRRGEFRSGEYPRRGRDGRELWVRVWYSPVLDELGKPVKVLAFAADLTARYAMEIALREAKERAEQAAAAKSTFLANMSHEIRTPMNAILGFTELLLDDTREPTQRRYLGTVRQSAQSLLRLLNDILDTAKLERGAVELEIADFSLRELCSQVLASLRVSAQAKALSLALDYPPALAEFFRGDALRLQQVLLNLLGNALKFTERGGVTLRVRRRDDGIELAVIDTGIGIEAERIAAIFDPFAQADASVTRRFGGTGLGTTIARQLVELMGGRLDVDSTVGVGSVFTVSLPLAPGQPPQGASQVRRTELPPLQVLVVDDVSQNTELLQLALSRAGHRVSIRHDGEQAVQACASEPFDLVLMDVHMPGVDGLEATRRIRRAEREQGRAAVPIIALTASVLAEDRLAARAAGMNGFVSKPVELAQLDAEIARVLIADEAQAAAQPAEPPAMRAVIDWAQGSHLWGDRAPLVDGIERFLAGAAQALQQLQAACAADDIEAARAIAHRLRGTAGNLALGVVQQRAAALEEALRGGCVAAAGWLAALQQAFDEVAAALGRSPQPMPAAAPVATDASARILPAVDRLLDVLPGGELDETALSTLREVCAPLGCEALAAIDEFDFERAQQCLRDWRARLGPLPEGA
ncbi:PAS domain S-box protein [Plasticicumulans acidivorans]|uniref:Sensor protein FixL n=1 Tax=Plasticicumulans acidivorans TaxID=886464 RepID=A0A317N0A6_9GAMM|nr:PAS domain S-box protein [Plasticicumulans acidivorans]PWV65876.1 PAS domain S-box-containing protein [Plasticicumulans acidivorans]